MSETDLAYVSQTLLATALYYGIAGGFIGHVLFTVLSFLARLLYSLFRSRA